MLRSVEERGVVRHGVQVVSHGLEPGYGLFV